LLRKADGGFGLGERRRAKLGGPNSPFGKNPIELRGIATEFVEPRTNWRNQRDEHFRQRRLERAKSLARERGERLLDGLAGDGRVDPDEVLGFGPTLERICIVGQGLRV